MTPKAANPLRSLLVLGTALLLTPAAHAVAPAPTDAEFSGSFAAISAQTAQAVIAQKADAAKAAAEAKAARAAQDEKDYPDGYGWKPNMSIQSVVPFAPGATAQSARVSPDSSYTPGHLCTPTDPNFKEYRYAEHIPYCNRNVTQQMKTEISAHYGVLQTAWNNYEFDHLIPLAIGGDSSNDNLWPQPHAPGTANGSEDKDKLEMQLYLQMKAGTIQQADAVKQIYAWFTVSNMAQDIIQVANN
jgi:hypothetical protein